MATRIASAIPFLKFEQGYSVQALIDDLVNSDVISYQEIDTLRCNNFYLLIEYIQSNYFVLSSHSNERLIRQSGGFVLPTALVIQPTDTYISATSTLEKAHCSMNDLFDSEVLIIPSESKATIREELDFFNINEATLFPELEHQMDYVKHKNVPISGMVPDFKKYSAALTDTPDIVSDRIPNLRKIVLDQFSDLSTQNQERLISEIEPQLLLIDWKQKESIRSQIRSAAKRVLQAELSAAQSGYRSEELLRVLLNPAEEYAKIEVKI